MIPNIGNESHPSIHTHYIHTLPIHCILSHTGVVRPESEPPQSTELPNTTEVLQNTNPSNPELPNTEPIPPNPVIQNAEIFNAIQPTGGITVKKVMFFGGM